MIATIQPNKLVEMVSRNHIVFVMAIVITGLVAIPQVYAEEAIVQVPFDYSGQSCNFNEIAVEYHCVWQSVQEPFTLQDLEEFKDIISDELYAKEFARLTYVEPEIVIELSEDEKTIQELTIKLDEGKATAGDATLLRLLKELDTCSQGLGNSSAIQQERTFEVSSYEVNQWNNLDSKTERLGKLLRAIQECNAQHILENQILTPAYKHFADANKAGNFDHHGMFEGISAIPYEQYTKSDFKVDIRGICASNQHVQAYKEQMGCDPPVYDGYYLDKNNGFISHYSPILEEYQLFLQDYGNRIATDKDKRLQEIIAEPIVKEAIENNVFYQNSLRD